MAIESWENKPPSNRQTCPIWRTLQIEFFTCKAEQVLKIWKTTIRSCASFAACARCDFCAPICKFLNLVFEEAWSEKQVCIICNPERAKKNILIIIIKNFNHTALIGHQTRVLIVVGPKVVDLLALLLRLLDFLIVRCLENTEPHKR